MELHRKVIRLILVVLVGGFFVFRDAFEDHNSSAPRADDLIAVGGDFGSLYHIYSIIDLKAIESPFYFRFKPRVVESKGVVELNHFWVAVV